VASESIFNEFENRELNTLELLLVLRSERLALTLQEFIQTRLSQGASAESIREILLNDLSTGGRIFSEFRSAIHSTARGSINRMRDASEYAEFGIETRYRWTAVLVRTCPDCIENHGAVQTWEEWEASLFGLPRSGGTICRDNCHCVLLPEETTELEPIQR